MWLQLWQGETYNYLFFNGWCLTILQWACNENHSILCLFLEIQGVAVTCDVAINSNQNRLLGGLFGNVREMDFNIKLCIGLINNLAATGGICVDETSIVQKNSHLGILISHISCMKEVEKPYKEEKTWESKGVEYEGSIWRVRW